MKKKKISDDETLIPDGEVFYVEQDGYEDRFGPYCYPCYQNTKRTMEVIKWGENGGVIPAGENFAIAIMQIHHRPLMC